MEILGERPVWSMSGGDMVSALDATYAEIARLKTFAVGGGSTVSHQVVLGRV